MMPFAFSFRSRSDQNETTLVSGRDFRFDIDEFVRYFSKSLSPRLIDLLRIAAAVYFTDRLNRRRQRKQQRYWSRSFVLKISVTDPDFWSNPANYELLTDTIEFLSDDTWKFEFQHDDRKPEFDIQRRMFIAPENAQVTLPSGGLDSAAGLGVRLATNPEIVRLPVTVWHQPIQRKLVLSQHRSLAGRFQSLADPLIIKTALIWTPQLEAFRQELSQRSRAFLFTAVGAVAASMIGRKSVEILESGVGAINLPLMAGMVGSRTTRSCHPEFHRRMGKLLSETTGDEFKLELPFFRATKGEVVKELMKHGLGDLARQTVSCVHFPLRESKHKQCGVCPACILRRQALAVADIQEDADTYKFDLFDSASRANNVPEKHRKFLNVLLDQVIHLSGVQSVETLPSRFRRHLYGTGVVSEEHSVETVIQVLKTYREEWKGIIAQARGRGISWTNLVATSDDVTEGATHATA